MASNSEIMSIYGGYKGINITNFDYRKLTGLSNFVSNYISSNYFNNCNFDKLDRISLDDVKKTTKEVLNKYFDITNIDYLDMDSTSNVDIQAYTPEEVYSEINKLLVEKSPYDLDVILVDGHSMTGAAAKPLIMTPNGLNTIGRKVYFSHFNLGEELTNISIGTYAHEIAHTQQERHIGYAEDYLHREVISIFIEKLVAIELDPTGKLLKLADGVRMMDLINRYHNLLFNNSGSVDKKVEDLMYLKSILLANKLFDLYINERKQKNKDKYIDDIQKVFDGKITVEELLGNRNVKIAGCDNPMLLKRRS